MTPVLPSRSRWDDPGTASSKIRREICVRFTLGVSSSLLYHIDDAYQHIVTFNYDFTPERGIVGRVVSQTGGTNGYVAYRQSGYGGVEKWLIVGDPNAEKFTERVMTKIVWPL
jgi:hypothetical protein